MGIPPTERLYSEDAGTLDFPAQVVSCTELPAGGWAVVLDRTFFYPESGGQRSDRGWIGKAEVVDVREEEEVVVHVVNQPVAEGPVTCRVDGEIRRDHTQQHSGQHVLSRAFIEIAEAHTISFHMGEADSTIDLDVESVEEEVLHRVEMLANRVVMENRPVRVMTVDAKKVDRPLRRNVPEGVERVRLVEVENFDTVPCCGTHVSATGEIGPIKIQRTERVKGRLRIHFKSGFRAIEDYVSKHELVSRLAERFTTAPEKLAERTEKLSSENKRLKKQLRRLGFMLLRYERTRLLDGARRVGSMRFVSAVLEGFDRGLLRSLASDFRNESKVVVLLGNEEGSVVCNASKDVKIDLASSVLQSAKKRGASAGGSGSFAEANLPHGESTREFIEEVIEDVSSDV